MSQGKYSELSDEEVVKELQSRIKSITQLLREIRDLLRSIR